MELRGLQGNIPSPCRFAIRGIDRALETNEDRCIEQPQDSPDYKSVSQYSMTQDQQEMRCLPRNCK